MSLKDKINPQRLPKHVAIIMDGNGRWAKCQGKDRLFGHQNGVESVREVTEASVELGIKFITFYAFSTENWNRPVDEIEGLMHLMIQAIENETPTLMKNNVRFEVIGDIQKINKETKEAIERITEKTKNNRALTMIIALSYSSRWEIEQAIKTIALEVKNGELDIDDINQDLISNHLCTKNYPDPDLLIRTSGEYRISNFLMWQLSYSELYFTDVFWPDFKRENYYEAILDFQSRERRFGKISEQLNK
ncbi:MAG: isoprenyl transferase [Bacteroidales bacterium]|jgi:undecaprenyl diphosphate synthase|nr:isoprenyl transferase [Bacteroidales bacterium]MDD4528802.1 isoprenyl transferase [Bacteroidales bacterium]MDD4829778.1 isoprenyl transferase [Bacteroidales bacterium]